MKAKITGKLPSRPHHLKKMKPGMIMKKVMRKWPYLQDGSTKCSKRTSFHKNKEEGISEEKKR